ncbi:MAG: efflux RND transporter permease subunit, partial [bacterium]|nr:efflux RND transporter permease subunit [bacterium]
MIVSDAAINRSTTVFVLLLLFIATGVYAWFALPRESEPEVVVPYITVMTAYEGVAPTDMESLVTVPIERKLTGISGIKETTSTSSEGISSIVIEFEADTVIEDALQRVRDKVDLAKQDLPEDADDPLVNEINVSEIPIMYLCLTGDLPLALLDEIAEDLEDRIESIKGVLDVAIIGGVEREIQIEVDPDRVAEYGISFSDLITVVRLENVNTPGGTMDLGEAKYLMRTPGEFRTPDELEGLVVKRGPTGAVYLRDIAVVRDGFKDIDTMSRVDGKTSITLTVSKRSGENIIEIADEVNVVLAQMLEDVPAGVDVAITWDESDYIRDMVAELVNNILSGLILVLLVIFIFLGVANAVFVALAIPVSMLITFAVLYASDITLNMVVLFSLILALGMLVDNGIVVVENIYRHYQAGMNRVQAAKTGAAEVAWPIISSTFTTVAAFVPMFFWPGIFGDFMFYLPFTVVVALLASLFVGLVVNPALTSVLMGGRSGTNRKADLKKHRFLNVYAGVLRLALRWRAVTIVLAFTVLAAITTIFSLTAEIEFMPETEPPQAYVEIECPEGTNLETSDGFVRKVERTIEPHGDHLDHIIASVGSKGAGAGFLSSGRSNTPHISRVTLDFPPLVDCEVLPSAILDEVRTQFDWMTGAEIRIGKKDMGPPTGPPINIEISGDDFDELAKIAKEVRQHIKDVPGLADLQDDYSKGKPEVRVVIDRQQAWKTGLNTQFIGMTVQAAINGRKAGDFREGDEEYDVTVRFPKEFRSDLTNIEDMNLVNLAGQPVPFSSVAKIEQGAGLGVINRIDRKRTVTVSAEVVGERQPTTVLNDVRKTMETFPMPPGYTADYTGENEDMEETQAFLLKAFVIAVFLIALVLITQFNSILQPIIILSSVLLSLGGVFLGLFICGMPFGILMTGVGCISLAGVVV